MFLLIVICSMSGDVPDAAIGQTGWLRAAEIMIVKDMAGKSDCSHIMLRSGHKVFVMGAPEKIITRIAGLGKANR